MQHLPHKHFTPRNAFFFLFRINPGPILRLCSRLTAQYKLLFFTVYSSLLLHLNLEMQNSGGNTFAPNLNFLIFQVASRKRPKMDDCPICSESLSDGRRTTVLGKKGSASVNRASENRKCNVVTQHGQRVHTYCRQHHVIPLYLE